MTGVADRHLCYHIPTAKVATALTKRRAFYSIAEQKGKPASVMLILIY